MAKPTASARHWRFPGSFDTQYETILRDTTDNLFEAVQAEAAGAQHHRFFRFFRSFNASSLGGTGKVQAGRESNLRGQGKQRPGPTTSATASSPARLPTRLSQSTPATPSRSRDVERGPSTTERQRTAADWARAGTPKQACCRYWAQHLGAHSHRGHCTFSKCADFEWNQKPETRNQKPMLSFRCFGSKSHELWPWLPNPPGQHMNIHWQRWRHSFYYVGHETLQLRPS